MRDERGSARRYAHVPSTVLPKVFGGHSLPWMYPYPLLVARQSGITMKSFSIHGNNQIHTILPRHSIWRPNPKQQPIYDTKDDCGCHPHHPYAGISPNQSRIPPSAMRRVAVVTTAAMSANTYDRYPWKASDRGGGDNQHIGQQIHRGQSDINRPPKMNRDYHNNRIEDIGENLPQHAIANRLASH